MPYTITTNNQPREVLHAWDLTPAERTDLGITTEAQATNDDRTWVRYRGELYSLRDFSTTWGLGITPHPFTGWDGYLTDTMGTGLVVKPAPDDFGSWDHVIVGRFVAHD